MKITAEPRSDQLNADDLIGGPRIVTIAAIHPGKAEQKYDIELVGEKRVWRPPLTVLRIMLAAWGEEASDWIGKSVELYRDESVSFGSDAVGGIRISRMTGLPDDTPMDLQLTSKRGKRSKHHIEPLTEAAPAPTPEPTAEQVAECNDVEALRAMWKVAGPERQAQIKARVDELNGASE
mgnify:CR=1 FL=1